MLQVITDRDRRGAQVFAVDLGSYLESRGVHVETVALQSGASQTQLDVPSLARGRSRLGYIRELQKRMQTADITIAHGSNTLMATAMASWGVSTPVVYRQISDLCFWAGQIQRRVRVRAYLRRMSHVVALWPGSREVLTSRFRVSARRISVIPNGVPPEAFLPPTQEERWVARRRFDIASDAAVVLYVGALVPEKGVDLLVRALARLPDVTLLVVGEGRALVTLRQLARDVAPGRVVFAGSLGDVREAYSAADMLVHPSLTEQMPGVVIEAALSALPVIATRVGALPTMIDDGVSGFLVDPDPAEIASRVLSVLNRPELGESARAHFMKEYAIDAVGDKWLQVLEAEIATTKPIVKND